jgi:hypothetical protein
MHNAAREVSFLGHVVSESGIMPDTAKIEAVNNITSPGKINDIRRFLGGCLLTEPRNRARNSSSEFELGIELRIGLHIEYKFAIYHCLKKTSQRRRF